MLSPPSFSLPHLDRLGDWLEADVAAGAIAGADLLVGSRGANVWRRTVGYRGSVAGEALRPDAI